MSGIKARVAEPEASTTSHSDATAEERRLNLLRQIAVAGGSISPQPEPYAGHGYAYVVQGDDIERDLAILAQRNYVEERFFDRVTLCPKCDSHHLNVREICPGCRGAHLTKEGLLHHFRCGYVGIPSEFSPAADGSYVCPKCNSQMHHLGIEFDRLGRSFLCRGCGIISDNPPVEAICLACGGRTPAGDLISTEVFTYVLTSRGAAAIRRGSFLDDKEELVDVADAPVYRRTVILEFLEHEMKRLQHFNVVFSLLLARCAPADIDHVGDAASVEWLNRLRDCLRDVDLLGQLADALYVVILPQTKRRQAEALRQRVAAGLGPQSPFTLYTVEITGRRDLAQALVGLDPRGAPR
ncbi:MAG TPA: hypothetical protein VJY39_02025 [Acidisphaera sp.]|nr:hypothetical protein [Acidisphaera sp.]